jgi:hypothetical protein
MWRINLVSHRNISIVDIFGPWKHKPAATRASIGAQPSPLTGQHHRREHQSCLAHRSDAHLLQGRKLCGWQGERRVVEVTLRGSAFLMETDFTPVDEPDVCDITSLGKWGSKERSSEDGNKMIG